MRATFAASTTSSRAAARRKRFILHTSYSTTRFCVFCLSGGVQGRRCPPTNITALYIFTARFTRGPNPPGLWNRLKVRSQSQSRVCTDCDLTQQMVGSITAYAPDYLPPSVARFRLSRPFVPCPLFSSSHPRRRFQPRVWCGRCRRSQRGRNIACLRLWRASTHDTPWIYIRREVACMFDKKLASGEHGGIAG